MRKIEYLAEKTKTKTKAKSKKNTNFHFIEAKFGAGKAGMVADKIGKILTKYLSIPVAISEIPEELPGKEKYFGFIGPKRCLKLVFTKGKSDELAYIEIYDSLSDIRPSSVLDLNGFNIVQVIDQIVDFISGEFERYKESFKKYDSILNEAKLTMADLAGEWLVANPNYANEIQRNTFDYNKGTILFINFLNKNHGINKSKLTSGAFKYYIKQASMDKSLGINSNAVPSISVTAPTNDGLSKLSFDLQAMWQKVQNPAPKVIMENLIHDVRRVASGDKLIPGLLVYGKPGTGKTQTVMDVLKEEGIKPVVIAEKMSAYTKFIGTMYKFKDGEIIVIDDNDSVFDKEESVDLLKKLLDMKPVRRVDISYPIKVSGTDEIVPGSFDFESKIIFLTNRTKMDTAMQTRLGGVMHEINFTKEEMLELIKDNLSNLYADIPSITDNMRKEVFDFVEQIMPVVNDIDYRAFNYCLQFRHSAEKAGLSDTAWKEKSMRFLTRYKKDFGSKAF